jgi:hypothetical protein
MVQQHILYWLSQRNDLLKANNTNTMAVSNVMVISVSYANLRKEQPAFCGNYRQYILFID